MRFRPHAAWHLEGADLENSWTSSDGVIGDCGVATSQDCVGLARDRSSAFWRHWDSDREASSDSSGSVETISQSELHW